MLTHRFFSFYLGLHNQGIYRLSGAASHIRKVKSFIEQCEYNCDDDKYVAI